MLRFTVVMCAMLSSIPADAIKWDFDDGTTQGWTAKEALVRGGTREFYQFPGVVDEGVWRIKIDPATTMRTSQAGVQVISSPIDYDSALFDQVRVRFRSVHDRPTEGAVSLEWENDSGFFHGISDTTGNFAETLIKRLVYTTEWQETVFSLAGQDRWAGLVKNIQLSFNHFEFVEGFEIDWIELTGVGEILEGERPPPPVEHYFDFAGVGTFAPPVFYPLAPGLGEAPLGEAYIGNRNSVGGVLTDLDGDGDLDLFGLWKTITDVEFGARQSISGWLMAVSDGQGALERGPLGTEVNEDGIGASIRVLGADLTGDGKAEIAIYRSNREPRTAVWSIDEELQVEVLVQIERPIHSVADWDGDGRVELFVGGTTFEGSLEEVIAGTAEFYSTLAVWDVEQGVWTVEEVAATEDYHPAQIGDFTDDGALDVFWTSIAGRENRWVVGALDMELLQSGVQGEVFEFDEDKGLLGVGDFDGDGQVDFLTEFSADIIEGSKGLVLQRKGAGDRLAAEVLYDDRLLRRSPVLVEDLNGDGVDDWVFIGGDRVLGFGVFVEWGGSVQPTQEGERYRLEGTPRHVLAGDMDNDGDVDLVVLDPLLGGAHVLKSTLAEQATAVRTSVASRPTRHRLGDSYPNPFNPSVVLPLDLATDAARVSLTVYDVLGRRVRQVWQGPLGAGSHRFVWDGRDESGRAVAAGVYVYQVAVDGQVEAKKMTKLP